MKKLLSIFCSVLLLSVIATAQETVYPAPAQKGIVFISNATIHIGNGQVIENGSIKISNGKIEEVGTGISIPGGATIVDAKGKHVYPGLILPASTLGLQEISGIRSMQDFNELGDVNASIRSIAAYNADSKIINTLRSNGILLAHVAPVGSLVGGQSSVVQLDAWNFEDAAYKADMGMNLFMPNLLSRPGGRFGAIFALFGPAQASDPIKEALDRLESVKAFFREAKTYLDDKGSKPTNLKFEAARGLFEKKQKLFVHCNQVKQMLLAIDFNKEFGFDVVIVGGKESWQIADLLKQNNIAVIVSQMHDLPTLDDDDVDQPYKMCAALQKAGVLFAINDDDPQNRGRNLPFNAGTAAAYGLSKEEALAAITLNTAKILGIDNQTGSIEKGKDANIIISQGDVLDMRSSIITDAFIQGRKISLDDKHKQLNERYKQKYGIK